jgi:hypothetical protein
VRATANLVPADDIDTFRLEVTDNFQLFCDGILRVSLTAAPGTTQRLDLIDPRGRMLASATSAGDRARASILERSCGGDDSAIITARVTTVSGHSAQPYVLERSGGF